MRAVFHSVFGREKLGRIQRAALNRPPCRRLWQRAAASRRAAARRSAMLARRRLALAGPGLLGGLAPVHRRPGPASRLARTFRPACRARACRWWCAAAAPDRAVVRAGFAHEPVGRRGRFHGAVPAAVHGRQVQRCWRWFQPDALHGGGEADLIAALVRSEVGRHGLDPTRACISPACRRAPAWRFLVALRHPQLVAALAMHSGPVTGDATPRACKPCAGARSSPCVRCWKACNPAAPGHAGHHPAGPARSAAVAPRNARQLFDQFRMLNGLHPQDMRRGPANHAPGAQAPASAAGKRGQSGRAVPGHAGHHPAGPARSLPWRRATRASCSISSACSTACIPGHSGRARWGWARTSPIAGSTLKDRRACRACLERGDPAVRYHSRGGPDASALIWRFFQAQRRARRRPCSGDRRKRLLFADREW